MSLQRQGQSEPDLVKAVRRAASQASGSSGGQRSRLGTQSGVSGSRYSGSNASRASTGCIAMTLESQQNHVLQEAQDRYLRALEQEATQAVQQNSIWSKQVQAGIHQEKHESHRRRELCQRNQAQILSQIEENKARATEKRRSYIEAASAHEFPLFTETFINEQELEEYRQSVKKNWRDELTQQKQTTDLLRNLVVKRDKEHAANRLQESIKSMQTDRHAELDRKMNERTQLRGSWERDIRLKSIKKAILSGKDMTSHVSSRPAEVEHIA